MANLFLVLSGEHEDLPVSEVKAILEAESYNYSIVEKLDQVLRLKADSSCIRALKRRAALTRTCALELFTSEATTRSIVEAMRSARLNEALKKDETFLVRVRHIRNYSKDMNGMTLEQKLGELMLDNTEKAKVKLRNPQKTFLGILSSRKFVFGQKLAEIPAAPFVLRRPRKKPFFHPSAMQAKLARCMVNLAQPKTGETVLDPFCGTGTMLIEASLMGCSTIGFDVQRRMVRGSLKNMMHFNVKPEGIIVADAKNPPINKINSLVTDPPYGISSTTMKRSTEQIIKDALTAVHGLLDKKRRICIAAPRKLNIAQLGPSMGYKHLESHFVYVHRSLTREIVVFEKV